VHHVERERICRLGVATRASLARGPIQQAAPVEPGTFVELLRWNFVINVLGEKIAVRSASVIAPASVFIRSLVGMVSGCCFWSLIYGPFG
jgi:hypothetical protein